MENRKSIAANRIPLSDTIKKIKGILTLRSHKPHREEAGEIEEHSVEHEGNVVGNIRTHDGDIVEHQASVDMQETGQDEAAAKKVGGKSAAPVKTVASRAAQQASDTDQMKPKESKSQPTANGSKEAEKVELKAPKQQGTDEGKKAKGSGKPDNSLFAPAKGKSGKTGIAEGDFKGETKSKIAAPASKSEPAKEKGVGKPDKSMSKMASMSSGETSGSDGLEKSNLAKADLPPLRPHYDIESKPGELNYKPKKQGEHTLDYKKKPAPVAASLDYSKNEQPPAQEPKWKQKLKQKTPEQINDFKKKLIGQRIQNPKEPGVAIEPEKKSYRIEDMAQALHKDLEPEGAGGSGWQRIMGALGRGPGSLKKSLDAEAPASTPCRYSKMEKARVDDGKSPEQKTEIRADRRKAAHKAERHGPINPPSYVQGEKGGISRTGAAARRGHLNTARDNAERRLDEMKAQPRPNLEKAGGLPAFKAPALPKPAAAKTGKLDEKKQELLQMARSGKERPLTSTPLGHALANYTDPNSFSFDPRFASMITSVNPSWAKKK